MGALASIATVVGAGASIYGQVRQAQAQHADNRAQAQIATTQEVLRQNALQAQQQEQSVQRQQALAHTIASARAKFAAGGLSPDDGSGAAVTAGLARDAAMSQAADNATLQARMAQGRSSLLNPDGTVTALLQSGRTFGFAARNLLD